MSAVIVVVHEGVGRGVEPGGWDGWVPTKHIPSNFTNQ